MNSTAHRACFNSCLRIEDHIGELTDMIEIGNARE